MNEREALKLALEHIEGNYTVSDKEAITAIKEALAQPEQEQVAYTGNGTAGREADVRPTGFFFQADKRQPEQEPVAWMNKHGACMSAVFKNVDATGGEYTIPLYTTPPQRTWVGLTDEEIKEIIGPWGPTPIKGYTRDLFDKIEAKLKEKNT